MFLKYIFLVPLLGSWCSTTPRAKRADVDLQTCIDNFDIHKDKIIRTQDSRTMGAKYLNEMDLDSREECLRLCCETENCDVFVYEEKNAGSCYLFQCGPPEDFKCKFTHHVNYTSAVLAVNRHLPDLESQIKLTKHEQDLTKLRKPDVVNVESVPLPPVTVTTQSTTTTTVKIKDVAKTKSPTESRKCSIYQFECRSTGECIAIYNACDGIPQCADGSDEAPELRCPDAAATTLPPLPIRQPKPGIAIVPLESQPARLQPMVRAQEEVYRPPVPQHVNQKAPVVQHQHEPDFIRPVDPISALRNSQFESASPYQPYLPNAQNWPAVQQPNVLPPQIHQLQESKNSHIFNHKDSGLQVSDEGEASPSQYGDGREYPKVSNYYGSEIYGQQMPQMPENWNTNPHDVRKTNPYPQEMNPGGRETWSQNVPVQTNREKQTEYKPVPVKQIPTTWNVEKETPKHEQEKMAHELRHSKEHFEAGHPDEEHAEGKAGESHEGHDHAHDKHVAVVAEYKIAADAIEALEDGVTERPSGAILSLTLGVIITSLMGIFIGCRLRVVRRRLRRGGKSYAHDADYLVNGMYL